MTSTFNTLGVVLARAGSKGLGGKHLLPLLGRPVVSYTLDHAAAAAALTRVAVSSDCPFVRRFGVARGFDPVVRPPEIATDDASVQDVLLHAVDALAAGGFAADAVVVLYGNVPVRPAGCVDRAVGLLRATGCDSVRSFTPVGKWHPAWMSRLDGDRVAPAAGANSIHRRQDLDPLWLHDGAVVAVSRASLERGRANRGDPHAFFGADRRGFAVGAGEAIEVDARRDLYWAEAVLRDLQERAEAQADLRRADRHRPDPTRGARADDAPAADHVQLRRAS